MNASERLSVYTGDIGWFDYGQIEQPVFADRNQLIWKAICEGSSWTPLGRERMRHLLKVMSNAAEELGIDLLLERGSLLAYIRHGGIMPWDDDIDTGIEESKLQTFLNKLSMVDGIANGLTTVEISLQAEISENTMESVHKRLLLKMNVRNMAQLIAKAYKTAILDHYWTNTVHY